MIMFIMRFKKIGHQDLRHLFTIYRYTFICYVMYVIKTAYLLIHNLINTKCYLA